MFTDPILKKLSQIYPAPTWTDRSAFLFEDLVDTIISQQLSGKAATSIFNRFKQLYPISTEHKHGALIKPIVIEQPDTFPTPEDVLATPIEKLRTIGISNSKAHYIHNVAQAFVDKTISIEQIRIMTDEEVIQTLTKIKGIGKWSAEMILIFTLNRPDVFSIGDLGLRTAIKNLYGVTDPKDITAVTRTWSPHRSVACWYLWRSLENR